MYKIMSPGPTQVTETVRMARSLTCTNPDFDLDFLEFYHETCSLISHLLGTENETLILGGEGILGLEAVCASLTEPGDQVLILDNGIYGRGFADFVSLYGGIPTLYTKPYDEALDAEELAHYLESNHAFKYATVVHCDTPSGMCNPIGTLCPLLKQYGILTVVDSVSAMFGEPVRVDEFGIDLLCGASQKAVSAPPGLTFVTISPAAFAAMRQRKTPIAAFYANLMIFDGYYEKKWFPYTMPISDIYGLRAAMDQIAADSDMLTRHKRLATACRTALKQAGLAFYLKSGFCNTVTVFCVPDGVTDTAILEKLKSDYGIFLSGSFDSLAGQVIRIGHMGVNASQEDMIATMDALGRTLQSLGVSLHCDLGSAFVGALSM
ncbi:MAG: alanine--glyoxylate aminotransferase family protein [Evtepia sp.]